MLKNQTTDDQIKEYILETVKKQKPRALCVTLRYNIERPETLEVGANALAGTDPAEIVKKANLMLAKDCDWKNPFGDGRAAERIVRILRERFP